MLELPPTREFDESESSNDVIAAVRVTLCRRFEELHTSRREDDISYFDGVEKGTEVNVITALPPGYERGGWRCHAKSMKSTGSDQVVVECLYPNRPQDEICTKCQHPKPNLRPQFAYLRLLPPGLRRQRREYERIIKSCDYELERCDAAENEAVERIAKQKEESDICTTAAIDEVQGANDAESAYHSLDEEALMMDVDLVQKGVWQRVDARALLPMLASRKIELNNRLSTARAELSIMIQSAYDLAALHVQRIARRFLVRCRLDDIRRSVREFACMSAAVEIQRIVRSKLSRIKAERLRRLRDHFMATKIQSIVRKRFAIKERQRLFDIFMAKLRNRSATVIQSLYRCHACKVQAQLLKEEKKRQMEEQEKARVASVEKDSAIIIQKHCRRILTLQEVANRRIEMGLHERLLMYIERYAVDGCMFSFVKSINDDYLRYERTITNTIDREEKMAKSFVEQVIQARDADHSSAWERYKNDEVSQMQPRNRKPAPKLGRTAQKPAGKNNHGSAMQQIYGSSSQPRRKTEAKKTRPKSRDDDPIEGKTSIHDNTDTTNGDLQPSCVVLDTPSNLPESERLMNLKRIRLHGQYLRFDIPNSIDDTVARFLMAVTLRYKFDAPGESSVHGNFHFESQSNVAKREHQQKCALFAEPLIQSLHRKGIVFIRQLLPVENLARTLTSMGVTEDFVQLSVSMINVLDQMHGGNHLNRKYLMTKCKHLLDAQKELARESGAAKPNTDKHHFNLASFLGECGAAGSAEDFNDDDNPGGLWKSTAIASNKQQENCTQERSTTSTDPLPHSGGRKTKGRSWVHGYTAKVISDNELKQPALGLYRNGQLLDRCRSKSSGYG